MRRTIVAVAVALSFVLSSGTPLAAHNWGAGAWQGYKCLIENENGECTGDDNFLGVFIAGNVPTGMKTAMQSSIANDYNIGTQYTAAETSFVQFVDVHVLVSDNRGATFWIYETCLSGATRGGGSGSYGWCKPHVIRIDPNTTAQGSSYSTCNSTCKAYLACHELGHVTGLAHPGTYPNVGSGRTTCMNYDDHPNPDDHDREHLIDCYPQPIPYPTGLTTLCDETTGI